LNITRKKKHSLKINMFGSVVAVAFQIIFCAEIHANDFFFIFEKLFLTSARENDPKHTNHIKF